MLPRRPTESASFYRTTPSVWMDSLARNDACIVENLVLIHLVASLSIGVHKVVIILIVVVVFGRILLGSLSEVDDATTGSAAAGDDVVEVDFFQVILFVFFLLLICEDRVRKSDTIWAVPNGLGVCVSSYQHRAPVNDISLRSYIARDSSAVGANKPHRRHRRHRRLPPWYPLAARPRRRPCPCPCFRSRPS